MKRKDMVSYDTGTEKALAAADECGHTLISVRDDWADGFPAPFTNLAV